MTVGVQAARQTEAALLPVPRPRIGVEAMAGRWVKISDSLQWIDSLDVAVDGDDLLIHVWGGSQPSPPDWGTARSKSVYASSMTTGDARGGGFMTHYELSGMDVEVQANLNLGLLVVATYVSFHAPAPFADRFTREFFRRELDEETNQ